MPEAISSTNVVAARDGADPTSFLGRTQELELIRLLLVGGTARLLTLTGAAGVGKTRLALEAGRRFGNAFPDGVRFVDLTTVRDPADVQFALAGSLGLRDIGAAPIHERLAASLGAHQTLLILDNFEQVLLAAPLLDTLLSLAPGLKLLVTSRELLHLRAEQTLPVQPFGLPDPAHLGPLSTLVEIPSVALFLQRAQMINPGFRLTDENAQAVAELCVRLDGLPLAIELAAARTQLLSPQMLLERLEQRLALLHWEAHDLPVRQHTLRSAIAWSYDLLVRDEQVLFACLGVFVGGFTLEAAETIVTNGRNHRVDVLECLASLVDKSLVLRVDYGDGGYRFRLMESVRDFALEQVARAEEDDAVGHAHAHYFLELAERAAPELVGRTQRAWFLRLEQEHGNLWAALRWWWNHGENEPALRLAAALGYFWEVRGYLREGQEALERALARVPGADPRLRARVLNRLGSVLISQGEAERSQVVIEEALALGRALKDADITARSLTQLGRRAISVRLPEDGTREATRLLEEALALRQQMGDRRGAANVRTPLGWLALGQRAYERAEPLGQEALAAYREVGDEAGATVTLVMLCLAAGEQGATARAVALARQGLEASTRLQDRRLLLLESYVVVWWLAGEPGDAEQLAILLGAAEAMGDAIASVPGGWPKARTPEAAAALQARLGKERFDAACKEGRGLSFSQIGELVSLVLNDVEAGGADAEESSEKRRPHTILSKREDEVLRLVAEGLTNKEIARELFVTENTVKTHVTSLFNKLGVDSRARAVAVAANEGLLDEATGEA
ncbi:MAG: transcriptional regulator, LuxR family [Chloroflexi bacterium]|nr:transcriptional regulator, LuxR family [Chloroflexota bacterium]